MKTLIALTLGLSLSAAAFCQPAAKAFPNTDVIIENAVLHPVSRESFRGSLWVHDGKIAALWADGGATPPAATAARKIDAQGQSVYPGLISAASLLGLVEIESIRASRDFAETGDNNANARAAIAINADSELIPVARAGGVLTVHTVPMNPQGLIVGQSAVVNLSGWNYEQMLVVADAALHIVWPSTMLPPWLPDAMRAEAEKAAAQRLVTLGTSIADARRYAQRKATDDQPVDLRLRALAEAIGGKRPIHVHAEDYASIRAALDFFGREKLPFVLVGGQDAWRLAAELKAQNVAVILGTPHALPFRRHEGFDVSYRSAARLHEAGVRFALTGEVSSMGAALEKNLGPTAGAAVGYGLPEADALRAITLSAAEVLGIADRLGSLDVGKDATLILTDGSPLELTTTVKQAFIRGVDVSLDNRHESLYQRYRARVEP